MEFRCSFTQNLEVTHKVARLETYARPDSGLKYCVVYWGGKALHDDLFSLTLEKRYILFRSATEVPRSVMNRGTNKICKCRAIEDLADACGDGHGHESPTSTFFCHLDQCHCQCQKSIIMHALASKVSEERIRHPGRFIRSRPYYPVCGRLD